MIFNENRNTIKVLEYVSLSTLRQRRPLDLTALSLEENGSTSAYMTFSIELCSDSNCFLFGNI